MATYPDGNPGEYPLDPATPVGQFRLLYGDTHSEPYSPVVIGTQNYDELSDAEIQVFLAQGAGSTTRSIAYLYLSMAGQAAKEAVMIKDYDLTVDQSKRPEALRALAQYWFGLADDEDAATAEDAFEIVPTGTRSGDFIPEGTLPIWGREYTWGRWR